MRFTTALLFILCVGWLQGIVIRPKESALTGNTGYPVENMETRYVELYLVVDRSLYTAIGNVNSVTETCKELANAIDTIYSQLNVRIVLTGLEIWKDSDKITISSDVASVLRDFQAYAVDNIKNVDSVHLLTAQKFSGTVVGLAYVGMMCRERYSGSVCTYNPATTFSNIVTTLAHEMGHTFGMSHDDNFSPPCVCDDTFFCIMQSTHFFLAQIYFSHCSVNTLHSFLKSEKGNCLKNKPAQEPFATTTCGNNVVDNGEECDCGSTVYCVNKCCDAATCKLKAGAQCFTGPCCKDCKLMAKDAVCRTAEGDCDVTDYCDGVNSHCENKFLEDGHGCTNEGACLDGQCKSRDLQCKWLWGGDAKSAENVCYTKVNAYGQKYGHCGISDVTKLYVGCSETDAVCGKLHCSNVAVTRPVIGFSSVKSEMTVDSNGVTVTCTGGSVELGMNQPDPGVVWDGTPCGPNKYCFGYKCVEKLTPGGTTVKPTTTTKAPVQTTVKPAVTTTTKPPVQTTVKPAVTTTTNLPVQTTVKPAVTTTTKPPVQTTVKPDVTTTTKPPVQTTVKPDVTTTTKPPVQTTVKPDVTTTTNPSVQTTVKPAPVDTVNPSEKTTRSSSAITTPSGPPVNASLIPTGTYYVNGTANTTLITNSERSLRISLSYMLLISILIVILY